MARRTKADAQQTRDAILDAAEQVFRDKGVARTRMEDIAKGADCTRGAVYWHFKNKTDVLLALSERVALPLYDRITQLISEQTADPLGAWLSHLRTSIEKIESNTRQQNTFDILINRCELTEEMEPLRVQERQRTIFFVDSTRRLFEFARGAGQLRADADLALVARAMHKMIYGFISLWLRHPDSFPLAETLVASANLLLDAVRVRE